MWYIYKPYFFLGLIKVEPFLLAHPKMQLHFNLYIMPLGHLLIYVIGKIKIESKTYGINFVVVTNHVTLSPLSHFIPHSQHEGGSYQKSHSPLTLNLKTLSRLLTTIIQYTI
jgi:hypothetical protein